MQHAEDIINDERAGLKAESGQWTALSVTNVFYE